METTDPLEQELAVRLRTGRYPRYSERLNKFETPITFYERVWGKFAKAGVLFQRHLRQADRQLYEAIRIHCRNRGADPKHFLPPSRAVLTQKQRDKLVSAAAALTARSKKDVLIDQPTQAALEKELESLIRRGKYERYSNRRDKTESPIDFMARVWGKFIEGGVFYQLHLRQADQGLLDGIRTFCRHRGVNSKYFLPPPRTEFTVKQAMTLKNKSF